MTEKMEALTLGIVKGTKKIFKWAAALGASILLVFVLVLLADMHRENEIKRWNWAHYTGFRVTRPTDSETEVRLGLWTDIKTGVRCTDKQYPGYPQCPPQEYVVSGVPTNIPDGWWVDAVSGVLEPIPDFIPAGTPPPQVTAGVIPKKAVRAAKPQPAPTAPVLFHYGNDKGSVTTDRYKDAFCNSDNRQVGDVFKYGETSSYYIHEINGSRQTAVPTYETLEQTLEAGDKLAAQMFNEACKSKDGTQ